MPTTAEIVRMSEFCCMLILATEASISEVKRSSNPDTWSWTTSWWSLTSRI